MGHPIVDVKFSGATMRQCTSAYDTLAVRKLNKKAEFSEEESPSFDDLPR
jgi:hypothetical protein